MTISIPVLRRTSCTNPRLSNDRLLLDAKKGNTFLGVVWGLMHLSAFWLPGKRHFHVILFSRCSIPKPRFWSIFRFTLGNRLEAVFFYFKENPGRHPGFSKWPESKLLKPAHFALPGKKYPRPWGPREGARWLSTWRRSPRRLGPGRTSARTSLQTVSTGPRIYFRARARRELAQPSLVTWCERATARESEGT